MFVPMQELFIKICGITNLEDAKLACELGVNAVGFNFSKTSGRYIGPDEAKSISLKLPEHVSKIGVFKDESHAYIQNVSRSVALSAVQLEGNYAPDDLVGYETSVIRTFTIDHLFDAEKMRNFLVDAFLLNNKADDTAGTPRKYHWDIMLKAKEYGRIIISGGLNVENIEDALRFVQPYGIDVTDGIEKKIGKKDPCLMKEIVSKARSILLQYDEDNDWL
jgi:phosphoribosylanthranilate isomerase